MLTLTNATYFLAGLADLEILIAIGLTLTALCTSKELRGKSNIMIAFVPVLELARVLIGNLHVIETYHPEWLSLSDVGCLVVARRGLFVSMGATRWLLAAIAIHMYLLCVKLRSHINTTKTSIIICVLIMIFFVLLGVVATCCNIHFYSPHVNKNASLTGTLHSNGSMSLTNILRGENITRKWAFDMQFISLTNASNMDVKTCQKRKNLMAFTNKINEVVFIVNIVLPLIVQIYFYTEINRHLNEERRRFQTNQQVSNRLRRNKRAVVRMLIASFICHFVFFLPMIFVDYFQLSLELRLLMLVLTLNSTTGGAVCFLFLHGGFR